MLDGATVLRCIVTVIRSAAEMQASAAVCWNCYWPHRHLHSVRAAAILLKTTTAHSYGHALGNPSPVITSSNSHDNPVRSYYLFFLSEMKKES